MEKQVCAVCYKLDGDTTEKDCEYCGYCGAWICEKDLPDMVRRAQALGKKITEKVKEFVPRRASGMTVKLR